MLTVMEASIYFSIGEKKIRRMAEDNDGNFALCNGNRYLIIRPLMQQYFVKLAKKEANTDAKSNTGE